jgi:hypothetical protein
MKAKDDDFDPSFSFDVVEDAPQAAWEFAGVVFFFRRPLGLDPDPVGALHIGASFIRIKPRCSFYVSIIHIKSLDGIMMRCVSRVAPLKNGSRHRRRRCCRRFCCCTLPVPPWCSQPTHPPTKPTTKTGAIQQARQEGGARGTSVDAKIHERLALKRKRGGGEQQQKQQQQRRKQQQPESSDEDNDEDDGDDDDGGSSGASGSESDLTDEEGGSDGDGGSDDSEDEDAPLPGELDASGSESDGDDNEDDAMEEDDDDKEEDDDSGDGDEEAEEEEAPAARGKKQPEKQQPSKQQQQQQQAKKQKDALEKGKQQKEQDKGKKQQQQGQDSQKQQQQQQQNGGGFYSATPEGTTYEAASFADLRLSRPLLRAVEALGYTEPTPIQAAVVPLALAGRDICGSAVTGSGKTAAFALPILERLLFRPRQVAAVYVLVLAPTRELAVQVHSMIEKLAQHTDITAALAVGGLSLQAQAAALRRGPEIVVATPGRAIDHLRNTAAFGLEDLAVLVLDEADRLLEMGFQDEVRRARVFAFFVVAVFAFFLFVPSAGERLAAVLEVQVVCSAPTTRAQTTQTNHLNN